MVSSCTFYSVIILHSLSSILDTRLTLECESRSHVIPGLSRVRSEVIHHLVRTVGFHPLVVIPEDRPKRRTPSRTADVQLTKDQTRIIMRVFSDELVMCHVWPARGWLGTRGSCDTNRNP